MKNSKKLFALVLAVVLAFALTTTAFAANSDVTDGSIEVLNPQSGQDYTAYKIFDVTYDGSNYSYTIPADSAWLSDVQAYATDKVPEGGTDPVDSDGLTLTPVKDASGNIVSYNVSFTDDFSAPDFAEEMLKVASTKSGTALSGTDTKKAEGLDLGYYLVKSSTGALANLTTTNADVQIYDKNEVPKVDKEILDTENHCGLEEGAGHVHSDACGTEGAYTCGLEEGAGAHTHTDACKETKVADKSIGDTVPYQLTTKIPDMTGYETYFFVVHDTLSSGLTFNDDVTITVGTKTLTKGTDFTVNEVVDDNGVKTGEIRIIFKDMVGNWTKHIYNTNDPVVIKYSATLNEGALIDEANTNDAYVQHSNDPSVTPKYVPDDPNPDPDDPGKTTNDPTGDGPHDSTDTYTTELTVNKTDGTNPLAGAEFKLEGTAANKVLVTAENFVPYVAPTEEGATAPTPYWLLKDGTYTTTAPTTKGVNQDAYVSTTDKYMKVETKTYETKGTNPVSAQAFVDSTTGKIVFTGLSEGVYTLTETVVPDGFNPIDPITVTIKFDETLEKFYIVEKAGVDESTGEVDPDTMTMSMTVVNEAGTILPTTGGIGTTIFYIAGSILLIGAVILLITKKRMGAEG